MPNDSSYQDAKVLAAESDLATASFAVRTLITIAERRKGIDAGRCRLVLLHFETATLLRRSLRGALARHQLTDLQFVVLVILFSTEPEVLPASLLAEHAQVSRASMTDALDKLASSKLATRTRDDADRRLVYVRITALGQEAVDAAVNDYLRTAEDAARELRTGSQRVLLSAYLQFLRALTHPSEPLDDEMKAL